MRTRAALVAAATLTGLLVVPTSAAAVAEMCQGRTATIVVATPGDDFTLGTEGDDVIVGHGPVLIKALGGNDVICFDAGQVDAGDGNDSVLVTGPKAPAEVMATLGAGDDRFVGGPQRELVDGAGSPGTDNIATGAGDDHVTSGDPAPSVGAVDPGQPNRDVVDLGIGEDVLVLALPAGSQVQAQAGDSRHDGLTFMGDSADVGFDLTTGAVTRAGVSVGSLLGFENFEVYTEGALAVLGTAGPEKVAFSADRIDLELRDGRDSVVLIGTSVAHPVSKTIGAGAAGVIDLGPGKDSMSAPAGRLLVGDLVRGRLVLKDSSRFRATLAMLGVEQFYGYAPRIVLRGGPEANRLLGDGCDVRLREAGADHLKR